MHRIARQKPCHIVASPMSAKCRMFPQHVARRKGVIQPPREVITTLVCMQHPLTCMMYTAKGGVNQVSLDKRLQCSIDDCDESVINNT